MTDELLDATDAAVPVTDQPEVEATEPAPRVMTGFAVGIREDRQMFVEIIGENARQATLTELLGMVEYAHKQFASAWEPQQDTSRLEKQLFELSGKVDFLLSLIDKK